MITIPQVSRRVPGSYTFRAAADTRIARLAQILEGLGVLTEADDAVRAPPSPRGRGAGGEGRRARKPWPNESEMVESAIARWTAQATGPLKVFSDVYLCVASDTVEQYIEHLRYAGMDEDAAEIDAGNSVLFALAPWDTGQCWIMQPRCEAIEKACPGLAQTALEVLHFAVHRTVQSLLPACALEFGEMLYGWNIEPDDSEEGRLNLKTFRDCFPPWVLIEKRIPKTRIAELARRNEVARAIHELDQAIADRHAMPPANPSHWLAAFGLVLRWSDKDPMVQIADDWVNDAQNGGEATTDYSVHAVKLDPDSVREFLDRFSRMLRTLACADRLVTLIAEAS